MAEQSDNGSQKKVRKKTALRKTIRLDMTPMVDLAFLLLTFFILTTTLNNPRSLELVMPSGEPGPPKPVNNAITLILSGQNSIYYYEDELKPETVLKKTDFSRVASILKSKNKPLAEALEAYRKNILADVAADSVKRAGEMDLYKKKGITVIIKYDSMATYRNTIDIVDEMEICAVPKGKYAIVKDLEPAEKKMLSGSYNK